MWTALKALFQKSDPAPTIPVAPAPGAHGLDLVCAKFGATHTRAIVSDHHEVQITLIRADGTLSATGANTAEAVERVIAKAEKCWGAA
jgi:hypothetical protein